MGYNQWGYDLGLCDGGRWRAVGAVRIVVDLDSELNNEDGKDRPL